MIVRLRRFAAVAVSSSLLLLLVSACSKPEAPTVMQPAPKPAVQAAIPPPVSTETMPDSLETSDEDVTTGVKTALLQDSILKAFDITVVTTKGDVRLTGQLDNQSQIDSALEITHAVTGVHSIHDELRVKP